MTVVLSYLETGVFFVYKYGVIRMCVMRVKVKIHCRQCGERFVLRGKKERGKIETGFKQCVCDNRDMFDIEEQDI